MAGLLQQILGLLGLARSPARKRTISQAALQRSGLTRCSQCNAAVRPGTPRCQQCGTRLTKSKGTPIADPGISDLQEKLLVACSICESRTIHVLPGSSIAEGEVKAGPLRISGDKALTAVDRLSQAGLIESTNDNSFLLTDKGQKEVDRLNEPI